MDRMCIIALAGFVLGGAAVWAIRRARRIPDDIVDGWDRLVAATMRRKA